MLEQQSTKGKSNRSKSLLLHAALAFLLFVPSLAQASDPVVFIVHGLFCDGKPNWSDPMRRAYKIGSVHEITFKNSGVEFGRAAGDWVKSARKQMSKVINQPKYRGRPVMIVSHSFGTVISMLLLKGGSVQGTYIEKLDMNVKQLITLGSPLGMSGSNEILSFKKVNIEFNKGPAKPVNVTRWLNVFDKGDPVAGQSNNLAGAKNHAVDVWGDDSYLNRIFNWKNFVDYRHTRVWFHKHVVEYIRYIHKRLRGDKARAPKWYFKLKKGKGASNAQNKYKKLGDAKKYHQLNIGFSDVKINAGPNGFEIEGKITAANLNSGIPERENLSVVADVATANNFSWPLLPEYFSHNPPGMAKGGSVLSSAQLAGSNVAKMQILDQVLRDVPVWRAYGGLGVWKNNAPNSVTKKFKGVIPFASGGKSIRLRGQLRREVGGPYANWESIGFQHDGIWQGTLPQIAKADEAPDNFDVKTLLSDLSLPFAEGLSYLFDVPGYMKLPDGAIVLSPEGGIEVAIENIDSAGDEYKYSLDIHRDEAMATLLLPKDGRRDFFDTFDLSSSDKLVSALPGGAMMEAGIAESTAPGNLIEMHVRYKRGSPWKRQVAIYPGGTQVTHYDTSSHQGLWGSAGIIKYAQDRKGRSHVDRFSAEMKFKGTEVLPGETYLVGGFGVAELKNASGTLVTVAPHTGYILNIRGSVLAENSAGHLATVSDGKAATLCPSIPITLRWLRDMKGIKLGSCPDQDDPDSNDVIEDNYNVWIPVRRGRNDSDVDDNGICVASEGEGVAYAHRKRPYPFTRDYSVSFEFNPKWDRADNLHLYSDGFIHLTLQSGLGLKYYDPSSNGAMSKEVSRLKKQQWYRFKVDAQPQNGTYTVYLNGKNIGNAKQVIPEKNKTAPKGFIIVGDNYDRTNYGAACWRKISFDFEIDDPPEPTPTPVMTLPPTPYFPLPEPTLASTPIPTQVVDDVVDYSTAMVDPCAEPKKFVTSLYHVLFAREPEGYQVTTLAEDIVEGLQRAEMIRGMINSDEYRPKWVDAKGFIRDAHRALLGRQPTADELRRWSGLIKKSTPAAINHVYNNLVNSAPYRETIKRCRDSGQNVGYLPGASAVGSLDAADCKMISGWARDPDSRRPISVHVYEGIAAKQKGIRNVIADKSRPDLGTADKMHGFQAPFPENFKDGKSYVIHAYGIDSAGTLTAVELKGSPKTVQCGGGGAGTGDFENALAKPCASESEFITSLYHSILEREAEPDRLQVHVNRLKQGTSRRELILGFFKSDSYRKRTTSDREFVRDAYQAVLARQPETQGLDYWTNMIKGRTDTNRGTILRIFFETDRYRTKFLNCHFKEGGSHDGHDHHQATPKPTAKPPVDHDHDIDLDIDIDREDHGGAEISNNSKQAYAEYISAYNRLTSLMASGQGDTPQAKRAYQSYHAAKLKYESSIKK